MNEKARNTPSSSDMSTRNTFSVVRVTMMADASRSGRGLNLV